MANRRFTSQFNYSMERMPVSMMGRFEQTDLGAFAALVANGITYTADRMGSAGNSITIALVAGGTAGSEVVTVSDTAISVSIQSGVSTRTQVKTALDNSVAAAALISVSVSSGATAATLQSATPLAGGDDSDFDSNAVGFSLVQSGTGLYEIVLPNTYANLLSCQMEVESSSIADKEMQVVSEDVAVSKIIAVRGISISAQALSNLSNGQAIYIRLDLRNSANPLTNS